MKKNRIIATLLLSTLVFLYACSSGVSVEDFVLNLEPVQKFLKEHPSANIRILFWNSETVELNQDMIVKACETKLPVKNYWYVKVEEAGSILKLWIDLETQQPVCVFREGSVAQASKETANVEENNSEKEKNSENANEEAKEENEIVCDVPYTQINGYCCLDRNSNAMCDEDEITPDNKKIKDRDEDDEEDDEDEGNSDENSNDNDKKEGNDKCEDDDDLSLDLSNYPCLFIKKEQFNGIIVSSGINNLATAGIVSGIGVQVPFITMKLPDEVVDINVQNIITIGNPCVNSVTAAVMYTKQGKPLPEDCAEGFAEGKGFIKLFNIGDYIALVVAGYNDQDTRQAARVLAEWNKWDLRGSTYIVQGTSLTDIVVKEIS